MRHKARFLVPLLIGGMALGCGSKDARSPSLTESAPADPIARVAHEFLSAVLQGDTDAASRLLTPLALERTRELDFAPPGSDTASFQVGRVEEIDANRAVVESIWTEIDADGQPQGQKITCALKLSAGNWRVSGMAAEMADNQPPVVIDFENPRQLIGPTQQRAEVASPATENPPRQATKPAQDPFRAAAG